MAESDRLLRTIETVHAAGLDEALWPGALADIGSVVGGIAATLEVFDRRTAKLIDFHGVGLPPANEIAYLDHYSALNPRIPALINSTPGGLVCDYTVLDEPAMNRNAFYAELLAPAGFRYFIGGTLAVDRRVACLFSVQRTRKQGHIGKREIALMRSLLPHVRQAFETAQRLRSAERSSGALAQALECLADGVVLLRSDGSITYANQAMQDIMRQDDGIRVMRNRIAFAATEAHCRFERALGNVARLHAGCLEPPETVDVPVARLSGRPCYLVSLRPLLRRTRRDSPEQAVAIAFVHDPLSSKTAAASLQREIFGFTEAESALAEALQAGIPPDRYARERAVSLNTVYTHLRRIKDKTDCSRLPELIRKLNDVQLHLRERQLRPAVARGK